MKLSERCRVWALIFGVSGMVVGAWIGATAMRQNAINRGFAEYNQRSGEWQWKTNIVKEVAK